MDDRGRVLIVDDNPMNVEILCRILRKDHTLATAFNGEECVRKVGEFRPQVVLLDIMMPGMDGYEACQQIKASCVGQFVQVILVSGKGSTAERLHGYEALADDYVVKPFDHDELRSKVRVQFRLWQAQRELSDARDQLALYANDLERLVTLRTRQLTATQDATVLALAQLAESRDTDTGDHLKRMRTYSQILAHKLARHPRFAGSITPEFLDDLYRSSPLHDIGKVGIADAILRKPGKLTSEEFETMKQHVLIGAETLERARDHVAGSFLTMAAQIARYHHERFDGTGYGAGLGGEDIPLAARIVALADAYDALTSERTYKPAYDPCVAREIIVRDSGSHFDPVIVEAFVASFEEFLTVCHSPSADPEESFLSRQVTATESRHHAECGLATQASVLEESFCA